MDIKLNVLIVAERTFNDLLREYVEYRHPKPLMTKPRKDDPPEAIDLYKRQYDRSMEYWNRTIDDVMRSTMIHDLTLDGIYAAIDRAVAMIRAAEHLASDVTELSKRRRLIEQIRSIIHISPAYPQDAMRRLQNLSKKLVEEPRPRYRETA